MSQFIQKFDVGLWTEVSSAVFMIAFIYLIIWVSSPKQQARYTRASQLPLDSE